MSDLQLVRMVSYKMNIVNQFLIFNNHSRRSLASFSLFILPISSPPFRSLHALDGHLDHLLWLISKLEVDKLTIG